MTHISLNGIRLYGFHGVSAEEQQVGSWFEIDLVISAAVSDAALLDDDLSGTIDYSQVLHIVQTQFATPSRLLEHLAHRTATALLNTFPMAQEADITVHKLAPPMRGHVRSAAVRLTLARK